MATHSSILVWKIPWTEKLDRLQSMGSKKSGTQLSTHELLHNLRLSGLMIYFCDIDTFGKKCSRL